MVGEGPVHLQLEMEVVVPCGSRGQLVEMGGISPSSLIEDGGKGIGGNSRIQTWKSHRANKVVMVWGWKEEVEKGLAKERKVLEEDRRFSKGRADPIRVRTLQVG